MGPTTSNLTLQGNTASTTERASTRPAQQPRPASEPVAVEPAAVEQGQAVSAAEAAEAAESVRQAVEQANDALRRSAVGVEFSLDQGSGRVIVRVVDSETKETLRQIPSEQMLAISRAIDDLRGLLIEQEA